MDFYKGNRYLALFCVLSVSFTIASEEAPSTPSRKRSYSNSTWVTPPKRQRCPGVITQEIGSLFASKCQMSDVFFPWWKSLDRGGRENFASKKDKGGKNILHHLILHKNPCAFVVAEEFPGCLIKFNNYYALPVDYLSATDTPLTDIARIERSLLQKTHCQSVKHAEWISELAKDQRLVNSKGQELCFSNESLPRELSCLIASMVVGDLGAGYRA